MRVIKFRAKDKHGNVMYSTSYYLVDGETFLRDEKYQNEVKVQPETVAQLIGEDRNGREVYEGDVIRSRYGSECRARFSHYDGIRDGTYNLVEARKCG